MGYPKIAQHDVNDSTLDITEMVISDPTPESFQLNQTQVIGSHSSYHPEIYAFDAAVSLAGAAAAFATVRVPGVKSKDGAVVEVAQKVDLSDADAFGDYAKAVMLNEEVSLNIYGKPGLKEGSLPKTTVTYDKTVTMKGKPLRHFCRERRDGDRIGPSQLITFMSIRSEQAQGLRCDRLPHPPQDRERPQHERNCLYPQSIRHDNNHGTSDILPSLEIFITKASFIQ